jgi:hypothetical protein
MFARRPDVNAFRAALSRTVVTVTGAAPAAVTADTVRSTPLAIPLNVLDSDVTG